MKNKNDNEKSLVDKLIKNKSTKFDNRLHLLPKGILLATLTKFYTPKDKDIISTLEKFQIDLLKQLSLYATDNEIENIFSYDFNEFFNLIIDSMNKSNITDDIADDKNSQSDEDVEDDKYDNTDDIDED